MRWIMTVKDHSTGLIWLSALPFERAKYVAFELEKYFGFVGYPEILNTNNGIEFIAALVCNRLLMNNPNCFLVMGHPRTPLD